MNSFDYVLLAVLGLTSVLGFARGLMKELMSLVAYVAASMAAIWWGPQTSGWLENLIATPLLRTAVGHIATFFVALLGVGLLNMALNALIEHTGLGSADHSLGALFGLAKGSVIVLGVILVAGYTQLPVEPWWQQSTLANTATNVIIGIKSYLPPDVAAWLPY